MKFVSLLNLVLRNLILLIIINLLFLSCEKQKELSPEETAYVTEIQEWHKRRIDRLTSKTGWLSLSGLFLG